MSALLPENIGVKKGAYPCSALYIMLVLMRDQINVEIVDVKMVSVPIVFIFDQTIFDRTVILEYFLLVSFAEKFGMHLEVTNGLFIIDILMF